MPAAKRPPCVVPGLRVLDPAPAQAAGRPLPLAVCLLSAVRVLRKRFPGVSRARHSLGF